MLMRLVAAQKLNGKLNQEDRRNVGKETTVKRA